jgi:hypothetical protein
MLLAAPGAWAPLLVTLIGAAPAGWLLARAEGQIAAGGALRAVLLGAAGVLAALALIALI